MLCEIGGKELTMVLVGLPWWLRWLKNLPTMQEIWVWSLGWKIPWRREWQPTPVFLPGEFHGQRSLDSYSLWGRKESDTTEWLTHTHTETHTHTHTQGTSYYKYRHSHSLKRDIADRPFTVLGMFLPLWLQFSWSACVLCCSVASDSFQPMDCSVPGSSVYGIFQARILKWVVISYSRGSSLTQG